MKRPRMRIVHRSQRLIMQDRLRRITKDRLRRMTTDERVTLPLGEKLRALALLDPEALDIVDELATRRLAEFYHPENIGKPVITIDRDGEQEGA